MKWSGAGTVHDTWTQHIGSPTQLPAPLSRHPRAVDSTSWIDDSMCLNVTSPLHNMHAGPPMHGPACPEWIGVHASPPEVNASPAEVHASAGWGPAVVMASAGGGPAGVEVSSRERIRKRRGTPPNADPWIYKGPESVTSSYNSTSQPRLSHDGLAQWYGP